MEQEQLQIFIKSIIDYFNKITGIPIEPGVPYLKDSLTNVILEYTGVIGISGKMQGAIYITADEQFIYELILNIMPGSEKSEEKISSMAGELANTIAGNAQKTLGKEFHISIPMVLTNKSNSHSNSFELRAPTFVVPLKWKEYPAYLVVGLKK